MKLDVVRTIRKTGERAFAVCASSRWNSLPAELRRCDSLASFKRQLKTHFFNVFFNVNDVSDDRLVAEPMNMDAFNPHCSLLIRLFSLLF